MGYVIGPILTDFLADQIGEGSTFTVVGIAGVVLGLILLVVTPKSITLRRLNSRSYQLLPDQHTVHAPVFRTK